MRGIGIDSRVKTLFKKGGIYLTTSKEKREFLEEVIPLASDPLCGNKMQKKLYDFLLENTNGGKLYKYRTFDSNGYALNSLINGTLHCSRPDVFNDPFDSKIGVTFSSLYEAKMENEIGSIENVFDKFLRVTNGELELSDCSDNEIKLIGDFFRNPTIRQFLLNISKGFSSEEESVEYLKKHGSVLIELLKLTAQDPALKQSLCITEKMLPRIIEKLDSNDVLNMRGEEKCIKELARENEIDNDTDEIGLTMLLSNKLHPEQKVAADNVEKILTDMDRIMTENMSSRFWVGCLATDQKNRLMWSHYADSHKGFCIEYDFNSLKDKILPFPIVYSEARPLMPWKATIDHTPESMIAATSALMLGLLTKDKAWEYENEWRVLLPSVNPPDIEVPITTVYLGANISHENKESILDIAKKQRIPVKQMKTDRGAYELHAENVFNF